MKFFVMTPTATSITTTILLMSFLCGTLFPEVSARFPVRRDLFRISPLINGRTFERDTLQDEDTRAMFRQLFGGYSYDNNARDLDMSMSMSMSMSMNLAPDPSGTPPVLPPSSADDFESVSTSMPVTTGDTPVDSVDGTDSVSAEKPDTNPQGGVAAGTTDNRSNTASGLSPGAMVGVVVASIAAALVIAGVVTRRNVPKNVHGENLSSSASSSSSPASIELVEGGDCNDAEESVSTPLFGSSLVTSSDALSPVDLDAATPGSDAAAASAGGVNATELL